MHCFFFREIDDGTFMLYFTELKSQSQRAFKRERGGGGVSAFSLVYFLSITFRNVRVNAAFVSPSLLDVTKVGT